MPRTTSSDTPSPRMPPSRNRYAVSGETTYGGFATTRSNCSPATGSKKLPALVSTLSTPFSTALSLVYASARWFTSVATTCSACAASRIAWIPLPVQRSSARSPPRRTVRWARATDGRCTPGTWSACRLRGRRVVGRDQQLVVRDEARRAVDDVAVVDEEARALEALSQRAADVPLDARTIDRDAEQQQPEQHGELVRVAEPTQVRRQLGRPGEELVAGTEPFLDPRRGVSGLPQKPGQVERGAGALRLGRIGSAGRWDAPERLHGAAPSGARTTCSSSGRT